MTIHRFAQKSLLLLAVLACAAATPRERSRDGGWWRDLGPEARVGYVSGFSDCSLSDAGERTFSGTTGYDIVQLVTKHYEGHPNQLTTAVSIVMMEVSTQVPKVARPGGERYPEKHGFFDGVYWSTAESEHRLAFIEGYLDCWRERRLKGATFSKGAAWYMAKVSEWYGVTDDGKQMRLERSGEKIADAVHRLKD